MNLPKVVTDFIKAQNDFDSTAYAACFTETAVVYDEGKTPTGSTAIKAPLRQSPNKVLAK